jgi:integrase
MDPRRAARPRCMGRRALLRGDQAERTRWALVWHFRVNLGRTLDIPWVPPTHQPVPSAFSVEEMAVIREEALGVHRRCRPVIDLLYSTGARLQEACGISLEDVKNTHIILRRSLFSS